MQRPSSIKQANFSTGKIILDKIENVGALRNLKSRLTPYEKPIKKFQSQPMKLMNKSYNKNYQQINTTKENYKKVDATKNEKPPKEINASSKPSFKHNSMSPLSNWRKKFLPNLIMIPTSAEMRSTFQSERIISNKNNKINFNFEDGLMDVDIATKKLISVVAPIKEREAKMRNPLYLWDHPPRMINNFASAPFSERRTFKTISDQRELLGENKTWNSQASENEFSPPSSSKINNEIQSQKQNFNIAKQMKRNSNSLNEEQEAEPISSIPYKRSSAVEFLRKHHPAYTPNNHDGFNTEAERYYKHRNNSIF